jgi:GT2 family glycosyltransferase
VAILFRNYDLVAQSGLFDPEYYLRSNPDVAVLNVDPLTHYLESGCRERRDPSGKFSTEHYLSQCGALGETPDNALLHYLTVGAEHGLTPRAGFKKSGQVVGGRGARVSGRAVKSNGAVTTLSPIRPAELVASSGTDEVPPGYVDFYGYSNAAGGWLFSGWVMRPSHTDHAATVESLLQYEQGRRPARATLAFFQRDDLVPKAIGVVAFAPGSSRVMGSLQYISFDLEGITYRAIAGYGTARLGDQELIERVRSNLTHRGFANRSREHLLSITARTGFTGQDTLSSLTEPVLLEIDEAILCPPDGVVIKGWHLAAPGVVRSVRVRSGPLSGDLLLNDSIVIERPDVITAVGQSLGFSDSRCGFVAYIPNAISQGDAPYIEIDLDNGEVGFKNLRISKRRGIDAIRRTLEGIEVRYGEVTPAFDKVLGPSISAINAARLRAPVAASQIDFGQMPASPRFSLIIPLYGRVDFIEYQMGLFSRHRAIREFETIYVLDDPSKQRELLSLAQSVFERFQIPFRLLLLPSNLGFAPANNVGLRAASGQFTCFLNSDIFPITDDWMERLAARLEQHPDIGVIGARLLFEDGSVQHEGCHYRTLKEFGGWTFIEHTNKGRRPRDSQELHRCDAITGACMVLRRSLALDLGGFDEAYIVGDFEDSDLCLRVKARGLSCAVDDDVRLYHLERKSQGPPSQNWRMNLTLYNAWVHQGRWFNRSTSPAEVESEQA